MILGLFHSDHLVDRQTCALWIGPQGKATVVAGGPQMVTRIPIAAVCQQGHRYRLRMSYSSHAQSLVVNLEEAAGERVLWSGSANQLAGLEGWEMDEAGVAQWDAGQTSTPKQPYRLLLQAVRVTRPGER